MTTATKKRKTRVTKPVVIKVVETPMVEVPVEKCFYCRESKYEPSTTGCPVSGHTQKQS
ncbi:hypothetical protein LCGC14_1254190 [marine sediment metagenome]|uniref:Uncharacterized protein n=1 Tax=marine sediment metagenome TaxID=412755 RepID=A0A0F9NJ79_9ZZZZ